MRLIAETPCLQKKRAGFCFFKSDKRIRYKIYLNIVTEEGRFI